MECVEIDLPHGWSTGRYTKYGTEIHGYDDNGDQETHYVTEVNVEERLIQGDGEVFLYGVVYLAKWSKEIDRVIGDDILIGGRGDDVVLGGDFSSHETKYSEKFERLRDDNGISYFQTSVESSYTDYVFKTYVGFGSISSNKEIYNKFADHWPDPADVNERQYVDVASTLNYQGFLSIASVQLPPDWGVASEHEGQTIVTGPKGENLVVGETYDNDFVEFTSLSTF